jgi:hypothetical protein
VCSAATILPDCSSDFEPACRRGATIGIGGGAESAAAAVGCSSLRAAPPSISWRGR